MGFIKSASSWHVTASGIITALLLLLPFRVSAGPSVNVALQASFDAAPYLLELLETAAGENSTAYFPLLDRIAEGVFQDAVTEKQLYDRFLKVVREDGHLADEESLSSFKFALAIRSAAPRIEAHYQYYNTSVQSSLGLAQDAACPVWVHMDGKQYCSSALERAQQDIAGDLDSRELPFDRTFGDVSAPPAVLYADVASPMFGEFHQKLSTLAREGQVSYRVRYRRPQHEDSRPVFVTGYGVELALKRTDYIVIDDRQAEAKEEKDPKRTKVTTPDTDDLEDESPADLKPLSASEVDRLGLNSASFVMDSADPFATLLKLTKDFPKYSPSIAAYNATDKFLEEFRGNRAARLPAGHNIFWINGIQIDFRQIDAYSLLEHLRRERKLIADFKKLGLSASQTVDLLSHPILVEAQANNEPQRYDWRDDAEGGGVIIWMNNLEKDKRYEDWPTSIMALLQRTYPGQLPSVRRDIHNVVVPIDLAREDDVRLLVNYIQVFIKRGVPVRFGLVPIVHSRDSISQAKIAHHLHDTYGLATLVKYFEETLSKKKIVLADKSAFQAAVADRPVRSDRQPLSFEEVLQSKELDDVVLRTAKYLKRLDSEGPSPPSFVNGVVLSRNENWLQEMPMRLSRDLQLLQQGVVQDVFQEDTWLPSYFLFQAAESRNEWIIPEDANNVRIVNLPYIADSRQDIMNKLLRVSSDEGHAATNNVHLVVIGDFNTEHGFELLAVALKFRQSHGEVEVIPLHNPATEKPSSGVSSILYRILTRADRADIAELLTEIESLKSSESTTAAEAAAEELEYWTETQRIVEDFGFVPGSLGVVLNGRAVGPLPSNVSLSEKDLEQLLAYELSRRLEPVSEALKALKLESKIPDTLSFAKLTSLVSLSAIPDVPEGIFDSSSKLRHSVFNNWNGTYSAITVSNSDDPTISIVVTLDPTAELSQRWVPILKTLSKLAGVNVKIFLNPRDRIQELPIKRFYRHVLEPEPSFDEEGSLIRPGASFSGLPKEALLNLGMDVPPSWLVAPKESIHDLDNIKLSSLKEGTNIDAIYALEHILIEGHSRDTTINSPPRGVQLILGTDKDPHFADTIIMANLGYFQFKAQPGFWKIELKPGRSQRIFNLDSVGGMGYSPKPGDENNEVALLSFQGKTLFPRLSRKPGHEDEDVLETGPKPGSAMDYVSKGLNFASGVLSNMGLAPKSETAEKHADINIFSVASGHLYERMLNIMMVSVMKHTKHTVKFWFIEQFLSPSFKSFLPHLAKEYGFSYEMVTYKWPHWLRGQREKQREIWGYKILFLDVLFPLSLDKVIFVDADQIVRTDMYDLVSLDLEGAPYGFTPMCDSREEMEGFRFWKQGYWKTFLKGLPYHISALYVVDLNRFRELAAGDRLRGQYQSLSADPASLSNLDQDLPNHMQHVIPIKSLPQDWLWCETWCSDEALTKARTIDLCNNPLTKEPKLDRARRQVPEWTAYDDEIAALAKRVASEQESSRRREAEEEAEDAEAEASPGWERKDEL
ncbi:hypothetical protein VTN77DRAFT_3128 [Rasamsonia byssochlamydoides]|uniref:uncharacterized protein n=1 Tax=Rasamsonia byssochlamydoides TaxID=89139 RepID=UPI003741F974